MPLDNMTTLKGIFPKPKPLGGKNFIRENVKNLRRMERVHHTSKEIKDLQVLHAQGCRSTSNKSQDINSNVNCASRKTEKSENSRLLSNQSKETDKQCSSLKASVPILPMKCNSRSTKSYRVIPSKVSGAKLVVGENKLFEKKGLQNTHAKESSDFKLLSEQSPSDGDKYNSKITYKNQGIQTFNTADNISNEQCLDTNEIPINRSNMALDEGDTMLVPITWNNDKNTTNNLKVDKCNNIASKMAVQLNNGILPSHYRKGVVPKYLRERKEARQQNEERAKNASSCHNCPEGHLPLPDSERKETLSMLKKNYQQFVDELNSMPIKTDTLRSQQRKAEIERQLNKLEEGIKVFSRPKVYVKINA
ncbi:uncharacterized protein LOC107267093 [Cephus cinctus]|uniref:Uncharacterized protein LOC107267093 n=1 Tax=Cephus cinctus TaxID=211228 RepID=A0AAJ7FIS2_CEPCN|nr:uncharacterized protein LOC107267093 [Cephus cinctus]